MGAPQLTFTASNNIVSAVSGYDSISVSFSSDIAYTAFECRATKVGAGVTWGLGKGALIASFSATPAGVSRTFDIYDDYLVNGDGEYRISLYAQSADGAWNDDEGFYTSQNFKMLTADGKTFMCRRTS